MQACRACPAEATCTSGTATCLDRHKTVVQGECRTDKAMVARQKEAKEAIAAALAIDAGRLTSFRAPNVAVALIR